MSLKAIQSAQPIQQILVSELVTPAGVPDKAEIRRARVLAGLTQSESAALVGLSHGSRWTEYEAGSHPIDPARWELYLYKVGQHPKFELNARAIQCEPVGNGPSGPPEQYEPVCCHSDELEVS